MNKAQCTAIDTPLGAGSGAAIARSGSTFGGFLYRVLLLPLRVFEVLLVWQDRATQRHRLREMDGHQLKDIGLSAAEVYKEASLPFWRRS